MHFKLHTFFSLAFFTATACLALLYSPELTRFLDRQARAMSYAAEFTERLAPDLFTAQKTNAPPAAPEEAQIHEMRYKGKLRRWWGFDGSRAGERAGVILLLHGSGRDGSSMLAPWVDLARREGLVLIAPDAFDSARWHLADEGSDFIEAMLAEQGRYYLTDRSRLWIFGHSAGAGLALALASDPPEGLRAVAVHGGAREPVKAWTSFIAPERADLRLYIGDADPLVPVETARRAAALHAEAGFNTELVIIPGHSHWFYDAADLIAEDAWAWLSLR